MWWVLRPAEFAHGEDYTPDSPVPANQPDEGWSPGLLFPQHWREGEIVRVHPQYTLPPDFWQALEVWRWCHNDTGMARSPDPGGFWDQASATLATLRIISDVRTRVNRQDDGGA